MCEYLSPSRIILVSKGFDVMAQESWIAKKCKVDIGTFINLIFFADGKASTMLVLALDQLETFYSQSKLAAVRNIIPD